MILRSALAAGLFFAAMPAIAGPDVSSTHSVVATPSGKLAHMAYRPNAQADCAASVMHTIPAGKIHYWAATQNAKCAGDEARADGKTRVAAKADAATARD